MKFILLLTILILYKNIVMDQTLNNILVKKEYYLNKKQLK